MPLLGHRALDWVVSEVSELACGSVAAGLERGGRQKEKGTVGVHQRGSATSG